MCLKIAILVGLLLAVSAQAQTETISQFAKSPTWRRSLFYKSNAKGFESLVATPEFFAAGPRGRTDPEGELLAELNLFRSYKGHDVGASSPQCRFPHRYKILKSRFQLPELPECEAFSAWSKKYQATGLSLVYASQYISNPSSAFGHSFLVATSEKQVESFWQTFNYAAAMPRDITAIAYAWGGITGWYSGDFSNMPFYQRLFYYGNVENRDLWIYPIKLTPEQLDSALKLLWEEVHSAKFTYYFLDENCAGELLRTFAAIFPDADFGEKLPTYFPPVEIVKILDQQKMLGAVRLVPSQYLVLRQKYRGLSSEERKSFRDVVSHPDQKIAMLDIGVTEAVMEFTAYQTRQNKGEVPAVYKDLEKRAFIQRAQYGTPSQPSTPSDSNLEGAPDLAHDKLAMSAGASNVNGHMAGDLMWRTAIHGIEDADAGFLKNSAFEFFKLSVSFDEHRVWLKDFTLINMNNFIPFWQTIPQFSWRVTVREVENLLNDSPTTPFFEAKVSIGMAFDWGRNLFYILGAASINDSPNLPQGHYEIGPEIGYRWASQRFRLFGYVNPGWNILETTKPYFKAGSGAALSLSRSYELIQDNQYEELTTLGQRGYRSGMSLRMFF